MATFARLTLVSLVAEIVLLPLIAAQTPQCLDAVREAKTVYIAVYHNPNSTVISPDPPENVAKVKRDLRMWPIASNDDRTFIGSTLRELNSWGRYTTVSNPSEADLLLVLRPTVSVHTDAACPDGRNCSQDIHKDASMWVYSSNEGCVQKYVVKSGVSLVQLFRNDVESN